MSEVYLIQEKKMVCAFHIKERSKKEGACKLAFLLYYFLIACCVQPGEHIHSVLQFSNCCLPGKPVGDTILYFGCRNKSVDFIYEEEMSKFVDSGLLTLHAAFSRDQEHKIYVQHLIDQNHDEIWNVLNNNGHLYICGYVVC